MLKTLLAAALPSLLPLALTGLTAGTAWVAVHLGTLLATKAKQSRAMGALAALNELVMAIVQDIEANEKAELISASGATVLTPAEGQKLKKIALDRLKSDLGGQGLATLAKVLQALVGSTSLDNLLSGKVEQAVAKVSVASSMQPVTPLKAAASPS